MRFPQNDDEYLDYALKIISFMLLMLLAAVIATTIGYILFP